MNDKLLPLRHELLGIMSEIKSFEYANRTKSDITDNLQKQFSSKVESIFARIEIAHGGGTGILDAISLLKQFYELSDLPSLKRDGRDIFRVVNAFRTENYIQRITSEDYRYFEEVNGTKIFESFIEEDDDLMDREYPMAVISGRVAESDSALTFTEEADRLSVLAFFRESEALADLFEIQEAIDDLCHRMILECATFTEVNRVNEDAVNALRILNKMHHDNPEAFYEQHQHFEIAKIKIRSCREIFSELSQREGQSKNVKVNGIELTEYDTYSFFNEVECIHRRITEQYYNGLIDTEEVPEHYHENLLGFVKRQIDIRGE